MLPVTNRCVTQAWNSVQRKGKLLELLVVTTKVNQLLPVNSRTNSRFPKVPTLRLILVSYIVAGII